MTEETFAIEVELSQPQLTLNGTEEMTQTAIISFGKWFKGDKGDSWDNDFDIATNTDIDELFV